jgi:hypothetical protein
MGEVKKRELFSRDIIEFRDKPLNEETACLSDIVSVLGQLSEYCSTLEYQNNGNESRRAFKTCLELEKNVSLFKRRIRDVRADITVKKK